MHYFRPIFVFILLLSTVTLFAIAATQLWRGTNPAMSWLGLLLASAAPLLYLLCNWFHQLRAVSVQAIGINILCGLGLAICMTANWKYGDAAGQIHLGAGLCLVLLFVYRKWIGEKPDPESRKQ